ncbi:MAG: ribose 5-phosphate isomerase B [Dehalococcoidales bacterium]|nr:ribose 5-phosphate isomerase B [Dehalococcoidales bacterium]
MKMKIASGADHGGFKLKNELVTRLNKKYDFLDLGSYALDPNDDYPDFALAVSSAVISGQVNRGILICGSGVGACITANKIRGIRACLCHDTYSAHQGVEHDDMNVLCLGARVIGIELAIELVESFLNSMFTGEARHRRRLSKITAIEAQASLATKEG